MAARSQCLLVTLLSALFACVPGHANPGAPFAFTPLDDFEDASPWIKGDPKTDLAQRDATVVASRDIVKQGEKSLDRKSVV